MAKASSKREVSAIKVHQWLDTWDKVKFSAKAYQSKPSEHFFLTSMRAGDLKALTGVYRRSTRSGTPRALDPNVQRGHEEERSQTIREFVRYGYPWCEMTEKQRAAPSAPDLRKPGWLPGAILVNILEAGAERNGQKIAATDLVAVVESGGTLRLVFPSTFTGPSWRPSKLFPLEVIDGQHRLWAFDGFDPGDDFELPVVAFYGLDRSWQAYLFWSVNITPKRINRSLAFDLYPLLRQEDWLDRFSGHSIYRETRSQELVEALWANSESPWHHRINMLGERKAERERPVPMVSQAAWIRSLMATLVKSWDGPSTKFGGLFGASAGEDAVLLPWTRAMQAALLIFAGTALRTSIERSKAPWAQSIRSKKQPALFPNEDPAFYGEHSLLTTDQGIRGFLFVLNDLLFVRAKELALSAWNWESSLGGKGAAGATEERALGIALRALEKQPLAKFIELMAEGLASYDWRTSSFPGLSEDERLRQSIFRGSSGYKELRRQLLLHLAQQKGDPAKAAATVAQQLGFTKSK